MTLDKQVWLDGGVSTSSESAEPIPDQRVSEDLLNGAASLLMPPYDNHGAEWLDAAKRWFDVYRATLGGRRVPIDTDRFDGPEHARRSEQDLLHSLCQLAEEQLAELKHLRSAVRESKESRSSANVKDSARGYDLDVKSYADGLLIEALDDAIREYARGKRELAALSARQWAETLDAGRAEQEAAS